MSKVVAFHRSKAAGGGPPPRRIGRDLIAVLVVGAGLGSGLAWTGANPSDAARLVDGGSARVEALVSRLISPAEKDDFPVSSIGKPPSTDNQQTKKMDFRRYPVCGMDVATRDNCVIDGDTFRYGGTTIRISDIDAPETHPPRCAREADLGDRATTRLSQLLGAGPFRLVRSDRDLDRYGRKLRVVIRDGRSIGRVLVSEGLARPWTGRRRPWCGDGESFG